MAARPPPLAPIDPDTPTADIRIGHARCSTLGRERDDRIDALAAKNIPRDKIFAEKISTRVRVRQRSRRPGPPHPTPHPGPRLPCRPAGAAGAGRPPLGHITLCSPCPGATFPRNIGTSAR
ncbi:hypothetical protein GCM10010405_43900 [Streptomyces macrosporus]|uniref:Resolvase/invertase-type recombinase catalytic domain-containing protein n=1 Tax=Streptomyces macrosporus TaxID=44032 RepID=A0ABN3KBM0_9ACTN